jgi:uncharacterized protein (DUF427 family)
MMEMMMPRAIWNGVVLAESDDTVVVEGNHYFPEESISWDHLQKSDHTSICPWKGTASYYSVVVDGQVNRDAAWYYPTPSAAAQEIAGRVAFWRGVKVERGNAASADGHAERPGLVQRLLGRA